MLPPLPMDLVHWQTEVVKHSHESSWGPTASLQGGKYLEPRLVGVLLVWQGWPDKDLLVSRRTSTVCAVGGDLEDLGTILGGIGGKQTDVSPGGPRRRDDKERTLVDCSHLRCLYAPVVGVILYDA